MSELTTAAPAGPTGAASGPFRRAFVRYPCGPATALQGVSTDQFKCRWGDALDISLGGIGLRLGRPFDLNTPLTILVKSLSLDRAFDLQAQVVNCAPQPDGTWKVGCEFLTQLTPEQLQALL